MSNTQTSGLIKNNSLGVRDIGGRKLLPGQVQRFTFEELKPFMGNKAFAEAFKRGDLQEIAEETPGVPDFLSFKENAPNPGKPDVSKLGEGSPIRVDTVEGKAALAAFLQEGIQAPASESQNGPIVPPVAS